MLIFRPPILSGFTAISGSNEHSKHRHYKKTDLIISLCHYTVTAKAGVWEVYKTISFRPRTILRPSVVKPGATLNEVVRGIYNDAKHLRENDYIVCIAGANDLGGRRMEPDSIPQEYKTVLTSVPHSRFVLYSSHTLWFKPSLHGKRKYQECEQEAEGAAKNPH